jgi:ABC-type multidrug transport system fused ATPase/permease subunit
MVGMLFLLGSSAASLVFPKLVGDLVDVSGEALLVQETNRVVLFLLVILVVQSFTSYFRIVLFVNVTEKTLADLRREAFNHLLRLPLSYFLGRRVGELNSRLSSDITLLQDVMTTTLAEFIRQIIIILGGITFLFYTSTELTLFMLSVVPIVMVLVVFFGRYIRKLSKKAQNEVAESNTIVEETLQGIQSVKVFTNEFFEVGRYKKITSQIAATGMQNGRMRGAFSSFTVMALFGAIAAVIWRGAALIGAGELETGKFISFVIYTLFIAGSIGGMAGIFGRLQKIIGATESLLEIFKEPVEQIQQLSIIDSKDQLKGKIEFKNLSFHYSTRKESEILKNLSFSIERDNLVAIVGPSGAGKTTLISLILRLYEPTSGGIYFDDKNSVSIPLSSLRSQMALVPQDIFLFGGTIRENIAYGKTSATEEEIVEAAKQANAWEFISKLSNGLDTLVGERGTQLSGGQRQRVAIARALLKNPRILILDEATSSLDSESERLVQDALDKLMKGRTSIVIAHRLSTIRKADEIIVLDKGQIVEKGTHEQLMLLDNGVYRGLSELQFAV